MASMTEKARRSAKALISSAAIMVGLGMSAAAQPPITKSIYHMMRRTSPGFTYAEYQAAVTQTFNGYITAQLNHTSLPDGEAFIAANLPLVNEQPVFLKTNYGASASLRAIPQRQMRDARTYRRLFSQQDLYEETVAFFSDHLNINQKKGNGWALFPHFHKNATRLNAFGQFRDLILASAGVSSARATAMLEYLDNRSSSCLAGAPNENYAREVLELHIMGGVDYTEQDIAFLAQYLSGWSFETGVNPIAPNWGQFKFRTGWHCSPPAGSLFLGLAITPNPNAPTEGIAALHQAIDYVGPNGQSSRNYIARKLARRFLTDLTPAVGSPEEAEINARIAAAEAAFGTDGDITAMLQALLTVNGVNAVIDGGLHKYMQPRLFASSLFRAVSATFNTPTEDYLRAYNLELETLAQVPYEFPPPIGYPDSFGAWIPNQPGRWSFAYRLLTNGINGINVDVDIPFAQVGGLNIPTAGNQVNLILAAGHLDPIDEVIIQRWVNDTVLTFANPTNPTPAELLYLKQHALALGASSPSFSRY